MTVTIGRYTLHQRLAAGGMAEVFLADDHPVAGAPRRVVIKRLFPNLAAQHTVAQMFHHEARVMAQLAHPVIPQVFEVGRDGATYFMAIEHVPGVDLAAIVREVGALPADLAITIVLQLLEALAHVHGRCDEQGQWLEIVHRDVAPANVLVTPDGYIKLIDFGIATSVARADDADGAMRGTHGYVAPEVILHSASADHRADVFGAGCVLYEASVGMKPFVGDALEAMWATVEKQAPSPSSLVPGYPSFLEDIVLRALAKKPDERFDSADEMAEQLESAAHAAGWMPSRLRLAAHLRAHCSALFPGYTPAE